MQLKDGISAYTLTHSFSLSLSRLNAEELLCNSSCFHHSVNTLSEEVCTAFSSTPSTLAGSDSSGPAATVTTFYKCLRSIYCHVDFMNIPVVVERHLPHL